MKSQSQSMGIRESFMIKKKSYLIRLLVCEINTWEFHVNMPYNQKLPGPGGSGMFILLHVLNSNPSSRTIFFLFFFFEKEDRNAR